MSFRRDPAIEGSCCNPFQIPHQDHAIMHMEEDGADTPNETGLKAAEEYLASEVHKLSLKERLEALDDVHCVGKEIETTPEALQDLLTEFDEEVKRSNDPTYKLAERLNKAYVEDTAFRLRFLFSKMNNVKQAVTQMLAFLRQKAMYFGKEALGRDILLSDLNTDDLDLMKSAIYYVQAERDSSGRAIVHMSQNAILIEDESVNALIRMAFFLFYNHVVPLAETATKGIVGIGYETQESQLEGPRLSMKSMLKIVDSCFSLPMRFSSLHYCLKPFGSTLARAAVQVMVRNCPKYVAQRTRVHIGTSMEIQYALQSHGIPMASFPLDKNGIVRVDVFRRSMDKLLGMDLWKRSGRKDSSPMDVECVKIPPGLKVRPGVVGPLSSDVLLGRGRGLQQHPGNIEFRIWMKAYREEYENAQRFKRYEVAADLKARYEAKGVRFLKKNDEDQWDYADANCVNEKIKQLFRSMRK
ncbi:unnamed protein product [Cylindrotheca closterium]|uniref:DUF6824 domain-containing protein n=1 Tax=Cylindrotheca closterium TaxID=2856 RepID=A0AAD2CMG2_9STRA|nr:unnamed protein product [Cylindrotheca closterium]